MSYTVALILDEEDAQKMNADLTDDNKLAFTVPAMDEFFCTVEEAEREFGVENEGTRYNVIGISTGQWNSTFPLPKRRKLPI